MRVYSIFNSISGEVGAIAQGALTTFVRLSGCNLKCTWCDAAYAQDSFGGTQMTVNEVMSQIKEIGCKRVLITGGEPLIQKGEVEDLVEQLDQFGFMIGLETNGSIMVPEEMHYLCFVVMDYKLPSSGCYSPKLQNEVVEESTMYFTDWLKFVIFSEEDYLVAKERALHWKERNFHIAFSPMLFSNGIYADDRLRINRLVQRMKEDELYHVVLNLQIHKLAQIEEPK